MFTKKSGLRRGQEAVMPLSVVDLYTKILPRTNCGDCGHPTCLAFASMVVSEKLPLDTCPHLGKAVVEKAQQELDAQHAAGKWTKRDMAEDALAWARERAAEIALEDLPARIGGKLTAGDGGTRLLLPYFDWTLFIGEGAITREDGEPLTRWEQVFIYNHIAQGGRAMPTGNWVGFQEIPNTVSKIKSMISHVETPLQERFAGRPVELAARAAVIGGSESTGADASADLDIIFSPFPRVPVRLFFWDEDREDGFDARAKLVFDETVTEHLDIESILFLSERLAGLLCDE
jgi:hypothetical protein